MFGKELERFFTDADINIVSQIVEKDRRHPLQRLIDPKNEDDQQVRVNTQRALKQIEAVDPGWIKKIKKKLLDTKDFSTASSALGEVRAYGYMLEAHLGVKPVPTKKDVATQDFLLEHGNEELFVEVFSKQANVDEAVDLEKFRERMYRRLDSQNVIYETEKLPNNLKPAYLAATSIHVHTPLGKGNSINEEAISKLTSIKQREHQLSQQHTSLVWLDFQDETWSMLLNPEHAFPLHSSRGQFSSGVFWYAFYGVKGMPIFDLQVLEEAPELPPVKMQHDGRFEQSNLLDGVIVSLPRHTFILENQNSLKPISSGFLEGLVRLPWFQNQYSYMNLFKGDLQQVIEQERRVLVALKDKLKYRL